MTAEEMSTREKLIEATLACLRDLGSGESTVKRIAERAGVNHGLVHHYFGSKERLMAEALRHLQDQLRAEIEPIADGIRKQPQSAVRKLFLSKVAFNTDLLRVLQEFLAMAHRMPLVAEEVRGMIKDRQAAIQELLQLDPTAAIVFFAGIFGLAVHHHADPDLPIEAAAERLAGLILAEKGKGAG